MSVTTVPRHAVAALFLERQHLARPRAHPLTPRRLVRFVEDAGGLQIDSINVVDRAHYLTLWSRFGPYDRAHLDRLVYGRRLLFEYWAHAACLVAASTLPWWRRAMLDYRVRHTGWSTWLRRNARVVRATREAIAAGGPMGNGDFSTPRRPGQRGGWWDWKPVQHALHYLWMTGAIGVHSRRHFQKRFDLLERIVPAVAACEPATPDAFARWHVERSLHAMGAATDADLAAYLTFPRFPRGRRQDAVAALRAAGEVVEVAVEGLGGRWWALARDLTALARAARRTPVLSGTTLLTPFDSLLWHRDRVRRLFG
ncbi:MAG TPA: crosslink repair DNA glycosylase YcaQ family protein, partial [Candidatus Tectomicrobia bacterium]|nr:crosslink repair DNA glycosylase YcaQ family protein [Candidatus Tectomicrobia bacterium]